MTTVGGCIVFATGVHWAVRHLSLLPRSSRDPARDPGGFPGLHEYQEVKVLAESESLLYYPLTLKILRNQSQEILIVHLVEKKVRVGSLK